MGRRRAPSDPFRHRRRLLLGVWLLCGLGVIGRAAQIQLFQGGHWDEMARRQQRAAAAIAAPRGRILDREYVPIVETRELYRVYVAPREVADPEAVTARLLEVLEVSEREVRRALGQDGGWIPLGSFPPSAYSELKSVQGIHFERSLKRDYPQGRMAGGILGTANEEGGVGGVEEVFDNLLRGVPGRSVVAKDVNGRALPGRVFEMQVPRAGGDLVLTLDADLQEIARATLEEHVASSGAEGGDLLVTDPRTGDILAAVSLRNGEDRGVGFMGDPVEPGSTIKPFTLAILLANGRAHLDDLVDVGEGTWRTECGRTLHDVGSRGILTVAQAIQKSSNVGVAKVARALPAAEQYEGLRDFGFGEATGIPLRGESAGTLRTPDHWTCPSAASLAIGYEIAATPLQMAMAYGALANGGRLMEPRLVKELRYADGRRETVDPRVVRRVVPQSVAEQVSQVLVDVVREGTGTRARLSAFTVAGKSGTARQFRGGSYTPGRYNSSFVGYFPAESPQVVIYAKLDGVDGYGGALAGPVTRETMEAALASAGTPIDIGTLPEDRPGATGPVIPVQYAGSGIAEPPPVAAEDAARGWADERQELEVKVPDLRGLPIRQAAQRLHRLGLRVEIRGSGSVRATLPEAGRTAVTGDTIVLRSGGADR
jgi:cell division protein FtsI (penicillin-binding protein 3)